MLMSDEDQMCEWSSVWSGKVPSKPSPAVQLRWPALTPSLHYRAAVPASVLPGHGGGEANQVRGDISDRKVVKITSSNYSRIFNNIIYIEELLPRHTTQTKTTAMTVVAYIPFMATRGSHDYVQSLSYDVASHREVCNDVPKKPCENQQTPVTRYKNNEDPDSPEEAEDGGRSQGDDDTVCYCQPSPCTCVQSSGYKQQQSA